MSKTNRREFLINSAPLIATPFLLPILSNHIIASPGHDSIDRLSSSARDQFQGDWRYCDKCFAMFWNGTASKGRCSAGGGHNAQGFNFSLPYGNLPETPKAQNYWRFCQKCYVMFFDYNPDKGRCPAGGGHQALGFLFRLPHDIGTNANNQGSWRYCQKCRAMFFDGNPGKGNCPAGGGHSGQGFLFVLPHSGDPDYHLHADLRTDGWAPIGGWMDITAHQNGDYTFSGHMHNSGALNIRYSLAAVLTTPSGQAFGFAINGHRVDGTETVLGRNRDHNWNDTKNDPRFARNFGQLQHATLNWRLVATATITGDIVNFLEKLGKETLEKMIQTATATPGIQLAKFYLNVMSKL